MVCPPKISKNFFSLQHLKEVKPITLYLFVIIPSLMGLFGVVYICNTMFKWYVIRATPYHTLNLISFKRVKRAGLKPIQQI